MRWALWLLPLTLTAAILIAALAERTPAPRSASDPGFSAERGMAIVERVAAEPHVTGTAANARVRDWLVTELRAAGLEVEVQRTTAVRQPKRFPQAALAAPVENVIAVLPGRDRAQPAVALMAHYDSVPYAPGAGDDAAGVAAVLETARLLAAGERPARDVVFLLTDGEERGLLGAHAFFASHPLSSHVGAVVNVEARGSGGRATMFQTSPGNVALVDLWAKHAIAPSGTSLADAIYRLLPNDTDLTVALEADKIGINAAFVGNQFDYHSPTDSPANLDRGSLQGLGDFALTTTRALAFAEALPARGGDATYFDVFGLGVVRYPQAWGWGLLVVAGAAFGWLNRRADALAVRYARLGGAIFGIVAVTVATAAALHFAPTLLYAEGATGGRELLAELPRAMWAYAALVAAAAMLAAWRIAGWFASIFVALLIAFGLQYALPGGGYLGVWPLLAGLAIAAVAVRRGLSDGVTLAVSALVGGVVFAWVLQTLHMAYVSVGAMSPGVLALAIPFGLLLLGPLFAAWSETGWSRKAGVALLVAGGAGLGALASTDGFSDRHPRPGDVFHLAVDGRAYWASQSGPGALPPGAVEVDVGAALRTRPWGIPAPDAAPVTWDKRLVMADGRAEIRFAATPAPTVIRIAVKPSAPVRLAALEDRAIRLTPDGWTVISWAVPVAQPLVLGMDADPGTRIEVETLLALPQAVPGGPAAAGPPTNWTLFSGGRVIVERTSFRVPAQ